MRHPAILLLGLLASRLAAQDFGPGMLSKASSLGDIRPDAAIFPVDMNADGRLDLLGADLQAVGCIIYMQQADGSFDAGTVTSFSIPIGFPTPIPADFDVDGFPDVASTYDHGCAVRLGQGNGKLGVLQIAPAPTYTLADPFAAADFSGDGLPDACLAVIDPGSSIVLGAKGHGDGTFGAWGELAHVRVALDLQAGDLDVDGDLDLLVVETPATPSNMPNGLEVLLNPGDGALALEGDALPLGYRRVSPPADVDADGLPDLIAFGSDDPPLRLLLGDGQGGFDDHDLLVDPGLVYVFDARTVDLDRDGYLDVALAAGGGLALQRLVRSKPTGPLVFVPALDLAERVAAGDFDGDGLPDVVVAAVVTSTGDADALLFDNALGPFIDLGLGSPGGPQLTASGNPRAGQAVGIALDPAGAPGPGLLLVGLEPLLAGSAAGLIVPDPLVVLPVSLPVALQQAWPADVPPGTLVYLQGVDLGGLHAGNAVIVVPEP